jgi:hypothetical protein
MKKCVKGTPIKSKNTKERKMGKLRTGGWASEEKTPPWCPIQTKDME